MGTPERIAKTAQGCDARKDTLRLRETSTGDGYGYGDGDCDQRQMSQSKLN